MAATIGALMVDIGANVARLQHDLNRAQSTFKRSTDTMKRMATGLGATLGVSLGAKAMIDAGQRSLDMADQFAKASRSIGISVENLSTLNHALILSGSNMDQFKTGARTLSKNMLDFANGTGEARVAFEELGITVTNQAGELRGVNSVILEIADKFASMEDGAQKTALAMRLFGRSGTDLIPMLDAGSAGIRTMQEEATKLGLAFSTDAAQAAERINDNMTRLNASMDGLVNKTMIRLIPDIENLSNMMFAAAENTTQMDYAARVVSTGMKLTASSAIGLSAALKATGDSIAGTAAAALFWIEGDYKSANQVLQWSAEDSATAVENAFKRIEQAWAGLPAATELAKTEVIKSSAVIAASSQNTATVLAKHATEAQSKMQQAFQGWGYTFSGMLTEMVHGADVSFKDILKSFSKMITQMIIQQAILNAMSSFSFFKDGGVISGGAALAYKDGGVFSAGKVTPFAGGGVVSSPTFFPMTSGVGLMGEAGPEAIMPLTRIGGKLGVKAEGSGSSNVVINQSFDMRDYTSEKRLQEAVQRAAHDGAQAGYQKVYSDIQRRGPISRQLGS